MSNFRENIVVPEVKRPKPVKLIESYKTESMISIIQNMINSSDVLSFDDIKKRSETSKLDEDELLATYSLGKEIKKAIASSKVSTEMLKLLSGEKLFQFIQETVQDMNEFRRLHPNLTWDFSINRILSKIKRKESDFSPTKVYKPSKADNKIGSKIIKLKRDDGQEK